MSYSWVTPCVAHPLADEAIGLVHGCVVFVVLRVETSHHLGARASRGPAGGTRRRGSGARVAMISSRVPVASAVRVAGPPTSAIRASLRVVRGHSSSPSFTRMLARRDHGSRIGLAFRRGKQREERHGIERRSPRSFALRELVERYATHDRPHAASTRSPRSSPRTCV